MNHTKYLSLKKCNDPLSFTHSVSSFLYLGQTIISKIIFVKLNFRLLARKTQVLLALITKLGCGT